MNMKKQLLLLVMMLLPMVASVNVFAYDIAVENADGVKIYYNYINNGNELEVTYLHGPSSSNNSSAYQGNVVIPEEVTFMSRTRSVTSIGNYAFSDCYFLTSVTIGNSVTSISNGAFSGCSGLTSVTIGNSVTSIGDDAFFGCRSLTSITIPNSVTSIGGRAFDGSDLATVISQIETPFAITGNNYDSRTFSKNTFLNATLYVPAGTLSQYEMTDGWKDFLFKEEGSGPGGGGGGGTQKCEKPTISYSNVKLTFHSSTSGAS